jgi:hypothetical protein
VVPEAQEQNPDALPQAIDIWNKQRSLKEPIRIAVGQVIASLAFKVRHRKPQNTSWPKDPMSFTQEPGGGRPRQVLKHVAGVKRVDRAGAQGELGCARPLYSVAPCEFCKLNLLFRNKAGSSQKANKARKARQCNRERVVKVSPTHRRGTSAPNVY